MRLGNLSSSILTFGILTLWISSALADSTRVDYGQQVAPLFKKYCAGCHNDADKEGNFSLDSFSSLQAGINGKPTLLPGDPAGSLLWRVMTPGGDPVMPPEGEAAPTEEERVLIQRWIEQGALGPAGMEPDRLTLHVPNIPARSGRSPVVSLAVSPQGDLLAVGRYGRIDLLKVEDASPAEWTTIRTLPGLPGKVKSLQFLQNGTQLLSTSGVTGSGGLITLWNLSDGTKAKEFPGHRDQILDAELSPDESLLATSSYEKSIILWDLQTGKPLRTLNGHNGAVYDLAFSPDGLVLASASADDTCKLWRVRDGERLDTLGQPLKEQYRVQFSPDGKSILAAGADNRLRVWKRSSTDESGINPLTLARFAHEAPIVTFCFSSDGTRLVTTAEDRTLKFWDARSYQEIELLTGQPEIISAIVPVPKQNRILLGRLDGSLDQLTLPSLPQKQNASNSTETAASTSAPLKPMTEMQEAEPNSTVPQAQPVELPATIHGVIHSETTVPDVDCFRFQAQAGETWVLDVNAARSKSPLDSIIDVVTEQGEPIPRVLLQAVRDSYFTFRGKNGGQIDDFRVFNWEEMTVNQFLYSQGEVVKLWQLPNGPDAGFRVYPGAGLRWNYFDSSSLSHALGEPCYIVEPHPPGTDLIPNGLPVFTRYFENDDAGLRESGADSKLFFTAPADGTYVARIRDVRGSQGAEFRYTLTIRPPAPDFSVTLGDLKPTVVAGNHAEVRFNVGRSDQFFGPITIDAEQLPPGVTLDTPIVVEEEQISALGVLTIAPGTTAPTPEQLQQIRLLATAMVEGKTVTHTIKSWTELKINDTPAVQIAIRPAAKGRQPLPGPENGPLEFEIHPGETIMLEVAIERNGFDGVIPFGTDDAGRNLPHGIYVDNIGLNGLLLLGDQSVREFFLTALPGVPEQTRTFHLNAAVQGGRASQPVVIRVRK